jgi:choline-sulfatase
MKTKITAFILLVIICTGVIFVLEWPYWSGNFLKGDPIPLIDRFRSSFIKNTHLAGRIKIVKKEPQKNGWQKIARVGSVIVWRTFSDSVIMPASDAQTPHLWQGETALVPEANVLRDDVKPGRWRYEGNQIFLTADANVNPNELKYDLDYATLADSTIRNITGEKVRPQVLRPQAVERPGRWLVFFPSHPLFVQKNDPPSPAIVLKKDGKTIQPTQWKWQTDSNITLYRASAFGFLRMFRAGNKYEREFYFKSGPVSIRVVARGEMAGKDFPRLGVFLDDQRIGAIEARTEQDDPYEISTFVREGPHHMKIIFENDYIDPLRNEDRNVDVSEISLIYKSALMLKFVPSYSLQSEYSIDYATHGWQADLYYQDFLNERKTNRQWMNAIAGKIELQNEERNSLVLGNGDQILIPLIVPSNGILRFGYGFHHPTGVSSTGGIVIRSHRAFHFPQTLFRKSWDDAPAWRDATVNLSSIAGQKIMLSIDSTATDHEKQNPYLSFIGNPIVASEQPTSSKPRYLILISFDALRADHLSAYGYERPTSPNIDAFARDSVLFENALTTVTWTLPSFSSLFTSLYPDFHNVRDLNNFLPESIPTLPAILKKNGFFNAGFVDSPLLYPVYGFAHGFDFYNYQITEVEERSQTLLRWIDSSLPQNEFLFVHLISPHSPYTAPDRYLRRFTTETVNMPASRQQQLQRSNAPCEKLSSKELEDLKVLYDAEILQLDEIFQHIVDHLKVKKLYDNAMIILMSDHGEEFQDHDNLFHGKGVYQETAHVPLIIKFPKGYPKFHGVRVSDRVQLIDVMPTVLDTFQLEKPEWMQGRSLLGTSLAQDRESRQDRTFFIDNSSGILGIVHGPYKYIYTNAGLLGHSCHTVRQEELYDLDKDPGEKVDLASQRADLLSFFRKERDSYEARAEAYRKSVQRPGESRTIQVDTTVREQIRALGYIQ